MGKWLCYLFMIFDIVYLFFLIFYTKQFVIFDITIPLFDEDYMFIWFPFHLSTKLFYIFSIYISLHFVSKLFPLNNLLLALHNKYLGTGLSLNKVNANNLFKSKNTLFIFDDLERISGVADIREILGFINELRENERFNIIIIANEEELNRIHNTKYLYYKEKMCIDKYSITYNPKIYEQLTKTDNVDLKNLYDRLIKPTCTISINSLTGQTNNLRFIILFINIVKKVYNKLKKDNVSIIENDINSILDADRNDKLCTYLILDSLLDKFKQYIKHIDDLKESLYKDNKNNNIVEENTGITKVFGYEEGGEDLSIITDKYIKEHFEITKLSLILDKALYFSNIIDCNQIIQEIINCENQISSFNDLRLILTFFVNCSEQYIEGNKEWLSKISSIWLKEGTSFDLENIYCNINPKLNVDIIENELIKFIKSDDILPWFINELNEGDSFYSITKMFKIILNHNPDVLLKINFNNYQPFIAYVFNNITKDDVNNIQILKQIRDTLDPHLQKLADETVLKNFK